jgi:hypothetical protein
MTFSSSHVDELISASLSGDLTDTERAELDAHLARCERCRATLAAFKSERRILSGLPTAYPPRDLSARVRAGIESGGLAAPWWRRPGGLVAIGASALTVAVAFVVVVFNQGPAEVGQASGSPEATLSSAPSISAAESLVPSVAPSMPSTFLAAGQLGYFELGGAPFEPSHLAFINDATGASIDAGIVSGPPIAASLSPDGQWLAYITQKGESGVNEVWALDLRDGTVTPLGCSVAARFTERLAWSPNSRWLAYTLMAVALGADAGCQAPGTGTDVWLFDVRAVEHHQFTGAGYAYTAQFGPDSPAGEGQLWVSFAMGQPQTALLFVPSRPGRETAEQAPGVFLPVVAASGNRALFWTGTMAPSGGDGSEWRFYLGGMPQLSGDFRSTGPASPWVGTPLFTDLIPYGGGAFAYGKFTWGPDSDLVAFWDGAWTGVPQSADGTYPAQQGVYVGRVSSGLLSSASRLPLTLEPNTWIVDVSFTPDGTAAVVTVGLASAGIGDPPSAYLQIVALAGGQPRTIGGGVNPPPWDGPAVFGH